MPNYTITPGNTRGFVFLETARGKIDLVQLFLKQTCSRFKKIPLPARIGTGVFLLVLAYVGVFVVPTPVQFSYASKDACISWFSVAPTVQKQRAGASDFTVEQRDMTSVFNVPLFSRTVCVTPSGVPKEGSTKVSTAPFGLPLFSKSFKVIMPPAPSANVGSLKDSEISAVKPLLIPLSTADAVHTYSLRHGDKLASCREAATGTTCAIDELDLTPNTAYELSVYRGFADATPQKIATLPIRTLTAVQLVDATVKNDTTIYTTATDFRYTFDRQLDQVQATLKRADAAATGDIAVDITVGDATVTVTPKLPLARNAAYQLTLTEVTGEDGASLAAPIVTPFTMSGGPKVASVSVGGSGVSQNARIVVTFDQPLKADVDMTAFARASGITAPVAKVSNNSITFAVAAGPLCTPFSLTIDKGLPSGSNSEVSSDAWKFDSRIICGSSTVIGYSVQGRSIIAYTFGSGGTALLFTGGMHGSEPSGVTTMQAWVTYLQSNGYKVPADKKIVIVPNTNPDGIAVGSRNNVNNVNIDRNFPATNWRPDIDTASGNLPTGGGTSAGSEPETKALMALTLQLRPRLEVSFHAQGSLVGANQFGDSVTIGAAYARTVGYGTMFGNAEEVMGYSISGEYEDWMGQELGIPAILIELPRTAGNYFNSQLKALLDIVAL